MQYSPLLVELLHDLRREQPRADANTLVTDFARSVTGRKLRADLDEINEFFASEQLDCARNALRKLVDGILPPPYGLQIIRLPHLLGIALQNQDDGRMTIVFALTHHLHTLLTELDA